MSTVPTDPTPTKVFLDVSEFTRNVTIEKDSDNTEYVTGEGVFDVVMNTLMKHLNVQLDNEKISGEMYAKMYSEVLAQGLNTAVQLLSAILQKDLLEAQIALVEAQIENELAKGATEAAKEALYIRQTKGFDDDAKLRLLKVLYDPYGVAFSVAKDNTSLEPPSGINKSVLDSITYDLTHNSSLGGSGGAIEIKDDPFIA